MIYEGKAKINLFNIQTEKAKTIIDFQMYKIKNLSNAKIF